MTQHEHHGNQNGEIEDHDRGLGFDLQTLRNRRAVLLGARRTAQVASALAASTASCTEIPEETAGPYPGDGSNGADVLTETGIVRRDIRSSFGSSSGTAVGVLFRFSVVVQDESTCKPVKGPAVYAWHCNRAGKYSMYSEGVTDQNYLRGVQVTGSYGWVTFQSIYPACYSGRWPHVHFEVYQSKWSAIHGGSILATSQMALPRKQSMNIYRNASGYSASVTNLEQISLSSDSVFGDDGGVHQLATVSGNLQDGYSAKLVVPISL
jgi:protocatechuate 3,4-dioxygenase beta subunit